MLAQEITEKQIAGGWENCPAWFHVPVEAQTIAGEGLPSAYPPPKESQASKFSGDTWGKVHEALHGYNHLTHFGCESMPDAPGQEVNQSQDSAGGV